MCDLSSRSSEPDKALAELRILMVRSPSRYFETFIDSTYGLWCLVILYYHLETGKQLRLNRLFPLCGVGEPFGTVITDVDIRKGYQYCCQLCGDVFATTVGTIEAKPRLSPEMIAIGAMRHESICVEMSYQLICSEDPKSLGYPQQTLD
ncbi:hypothetical protein RF11_09238 [Thelohanellus kitauei]|uniref:Uncharacterized protein n=1 Tax=Thelohanellus kitauei TaxID=669202 RepID=A0A0C2J0A0_THEKT|nr:hypothetical protein RF11_09238 [Thelohanellus kitauei]